MHRLVFIYDAQELCANAKEKAFYWLASENINTCIDEKIILHAKFYF
jgi:hypothetical protein